MSLRSGPLGLVLLSIPPAGTTQGLPLSESNHCWLDCLTCVLRTAFLSHREMPKASPNFR
jgi:hypothetical protein